MRIFTLFAVLLLSLASNAEDVGVEGKVLSIEECSKEVMVWVSLDKENYKERLLLMHTLVPVGGKFQFYLKPGSYQLHASDEKGCSFFEKISVKTMLDLDIRMKK